MLKIIELLLEFSSHSSLKIIDFITNIALFILFALFIIVLFLYLHNIYFIIGWLVLFLVIWFINFLINIVKSLSIIKEKENDNEIKIHLSANTNDINDFIKQIREYIYYILINISKFIPYILINSLFFTFLKILPYSNIIGEIMLTILLILAIVVIFCILINKKLKNFKVVNFFLYIFCFILVVYSIITLLSKINDKALDSLLLKKDEGNTDETKIFIRLSDSLDENILSKFLYAVSIVYYILLIIFNFISIFAFSIYDIISSSQIYTMLGLKPSINYKERVNVIIKSRLNTLIEYFFTKMNQMLNPH